MMNVLCTLNGVEVPTELQQVIQTVYNLIRIGVPLLLVVFGMLDLGKAVMQQKEDDIKKGQSTFVKRLLAAAIVFFVLSIVQLLLSIVDKKDGSNIFSQISCLLTGKAE